MVVSGIDLNKLKQKELTRWQLFCLWFWKKFRLLDKPESLPLRDFDAEPGQYTWEDWEEDTRKACPVRYFLQETLGFWFWRRLKSKLSDAYWWVRHRTTHRYHIVDISDKRNGYHRGWIDRDDAIVHASFALLKDFVENESHHIDWEYDKQHFRAHTEMMYLYNWWTKERPQYAYEWYKDPTVYDKKDTEMLVRLAKVRPFLWS